MTDTTHAIMMSQNHLSELEKKKKKKKKKKSNFMKEQELLALTESVRELSTRLQAPSNRIP